MPLLNRNRYLKCFYCGFRTSTAFDGKIRRFECLKCEATNYLDENGEITDPPVATERIATPARYAASHAPSPPTSPTDAVFCATCLKNQHLLRASLAQYLPDPDDPEYAAREKNLYKFRNRQEKLYPQICAECEPRVRQRMEQAAYTAKADVLRRMVDRSTMIRRSSTQTSWLNRLDWLGRWLWLGGLFFQLTWHASILQEVYLQHFQELGGDPQAFLPVILLKSCGAVLERLPSTDRLISLSTTASVMSVWWCPRFVQIFRGFSKHIKGVSAWYTFQAIAIVLRLLLPKVPGITKPDLSLIYLQTAGHVLGAGFALLIYVLGPRSIRIDMSPLFQPSSAAASPRFDRLQHNAIEPLSPSPSQKDETKSMAELLDEISHTPTANQLVSFNRPPSPVTLDEDMSLPSFSRKKPQMGFSHIPRQTEELPIDLLNLSSSRVPSAAPQYEQEMDWSPTQSKYRAFNTYGQRQTQGFGEAPTEEHKGTFWYRVPPAPTTPAQLVYNPPNQPLLRKSPLTREQERQRQQQHNVLFRGNDRTLLARDANFHNRQDDGNASQHRVAFAEQSFFPPAPQNDPRNSLSELFGESLALTPSQQEDRRAQAEREGGSWISRPWLGLLGTGGSEKKRK
ncbi:Ima1 N-terminal domain-containing protein [Lasiosphaeria ovina]|uniref:Ima1 N-terminal domain-containing protein n=1 Tax=Lasiosphaeria ovina TaxID=92902 RepID=A0AAE0K988_9PEZI|nr:Ima1 N-terminal domain-containing protein [Lasiosphaeria ovina]